ncbi:MAG: hypothetical protein ACRDPR_10495, partial [Nocardioidaceae bacterium]
MYKIRASRRVPKLLLLLTVAATAVVFLAPTAQAAAGLSVTKTASPADGGTVSPGDPIDYTIVVANAGPDPATLLTFTDPTPADTSYVADSATVNSVQVLGASNPFDSAYSLPDLGAGLSHTITLQVTVNTPLANGSTVTNTASASSPDDPASPLQDSTAHTVASAPSLTVNKTASPAEGGSVAPGDTVTYTVVVGNDAAATDTATGVSVTDPVPADTSYVADSATEDGSPLLGATNPFETGYALTDSTLSPGETHTLTFDVDVDSPLPNGTLVSNTATATAANAADATDSATHTVASAPGLAVDKTASPPEGGPVAPGDTISYSVVVSNDALATDTATNVVLTDATPAGTTYVADSATVDTVPVPGATNPFETAYGLPDMAPGDSHTFTFQVLADPVLDNGTSITNTATLDSDQGSATDDATHTVSSQSTLTLVKTASPAEGGPVTPGTTISYSMVITNDAAANEVADQLVLTDPTPAGTAYFSGSAKIDDAAIFGDQNPLAEGLDLPDLAPGESVTVTYDVQVNSPLANGTVVSNLATLSADNHPDLSDEATHTVDSAAVMKVEVTATPVAGSDVKSGQTIVYTVNVSNDPAASATLTGVTATDTPPQGATLDPGSVRTVSTASTAPASTTGDDEEIEGAVLLVEDVSLSGLEIMNLNNALWWELAQGSSLSSALLRHPNVAGNMLVLDSQMHGEDPPGHPMWLFGLSRDGLEALKAANPEVSRVIDAALADYYPNRMCFEYALAEYQVDLGLTPTISPELADWRESVGLDPTYEARLRSAIEEVFDPGTLPPLATQQSSESSESGDVPLGDLAPGDSATTTFTVTVGRSASGQLTNTVTVAAANHPS